MATDGGGGGKGGADSGGVRGGGTCGTRGTVRRCGGAWVPPLARAGATCMGGDTGSHDGGVPAAYFLSFTSLTSDSRMGDMSESCGLGGAVAAPPPPAGRITHRASAMQLRR